MFTNRSLKVLPIIVFLTITLMLGGCKALGVETQSEDIRAVADQITGYQLPEGYTESFAADLLGYQLVNLQGSTPSCHIYLVQAPVGTDVDIARLQEQARSLKGDRDQDTLRDVHVVETRTAVLRGEDVPVLVGEGVNSENLPYREITALFTGRGGPALVSISSPVDLWNWDQVDGFLASFE